MQHYRYLERSPGITASFPVDEQTSTSLSFPPLAYLRERDETRRNETKRNAKRHVNPLSWKSLTSVCIPIDFMTNTTPREYLSCCIRLDLFGEPRFLASVHTTMAKLQFRRDLRVDPII